ncbi:MAG TPA: GntR family transcriptional regulator [Vicinamibacterales bacterium]|nr:GntR family transcriptional regulator [Vicinamibacterales bacterium]
MSQPAAGHLRAYDADALRTQSRADFVYGSLRDAIWEGRFAHGERIREEEIAGVLGVSRTPVREALQRLQQRGLLVVGPGRGLMVAQLSKQQVFELYAMRRCSSSVSGRRFGTRNVVLCRSASESFSVSSVCNKY